MRLIRNLSFFEKICPFYHCLHNDTIILPLELVRLVQSFLVSLGHMSVVFPRVTACWVERWCRANGNIIFVCIPYANLKCNKSITVTRRFFKSLVYFDLSTHHWLAYQIDNSHYFLYQFLKLVRRRLICVQKN